jgi:hypothetical protein
MPLEHRTSVSILTHICSCPTVILLRHNVWQSQMRETNSELAILGESENTIHEATRILFAGFLRVVSWMILFLYPNLLRFDFSYRIHLPSVRARTPSMKRLISSEVV